MSFKIQREEEQRDQTQPQQTQSQHTPQNESWERDTLYKLLLSVHKEQRAGRFWRNVWRGVGAMLFAGTLFTFHSCASGRFEADNGGGLNKILGAKNKEHTAVIKLNGVIGGGYQDQVDLLRDGLEAAYADKNVKGIIIRANSPGGSPVVSNTAFNEIRRLKEQHKDIPLYLVAEDMCASGCYYIAAAADKIYADPSSLVGSIGVIGGSFDFTGIMDKLGIKRRLRTTPSPPKPPNKPPSGSKCSTTSTANSSTPSKPDAAAASKPTTRRYSAAASTPASKRKKTASSTASATYTASPATKSKPPTSSTTPPTKTTSPAPSAAASTAKCKTKCAKASKTSTQKAGKPAAEHRGRLKNTFQTASAL